MAIRIMNPEKFIEYMWKGKPVTEAEFLNLSGSKMVKAWRHRREVNPFNGIITKTKTLCEVPLIVIESQRYTLDNYLEEI